MDSKTYEVDLPGYSLSYLINGDSSGIDEIDVKNIDDFMKQFYDEAAELNGNVVIDVVDEEGSFTHYPKFGLACDCYASNINILF